MSVHALIFALGIKHGVEMGGAPLIPFTGTRNCDSATIKACTTCYVPIYTYVYTYMCICMSNICMYVLSILVACYYFMVLIIRLDVVKSQKDCLFKLDNGND